MKIKGIEVTNILVDDNGNYWSFPYYSNIEILKDLLINNKKITICDKDLKNKINNHGT